MLDSYSSGLETLGDQTYSYSDQTVGIAFVILQLSRDICQKHVGSGSMRGALIVQWWSNCSRGKAELLIHILSNLGNSAQLNSVEHKEWCGE